MNEQQTITNYATAEKKDHDNKCTKRKLNLAHGLDNHPLLKKVYTMKDGKMYDKYDTVCLGPFTFVSIGGSKFVEVILYGEMTAFWIQHNDGIFYLVVPYAVMPRLLSSAFEFQHEWEQHLLEAHYAKDIHAVQFVDWLPALVRTTWTLAQPTKEFLFKSFQFAVSDLAWRSSLCKRWAPDLVAFCCGVGLLNDADMNVRAILAAIVDAPLVVSAAEAENFFARCVMRRLSTGAIMMPAVQLVIVEYAKRCGSAASRQAAFNNLVDVFIDSNGREDAVAHMLFVMAQAEIKFDMQHTMRRFSEMAISGASVSASILQTFFRLFQLVSLNAEYLRAVFSFATTTLARTARTHDNVKLAKCLCALARMAHPDDQPNMLSRGPVVRDEVSGSIYPLAIVLTADHLMSRISFQLTLPADCFESASTTLMCDETVLVHWADTVVVCEPGARRHVTCFSSSSNDTVILQRLSCPTYTTASPMLSREWLELLSNEWWTWRDEITDGRVHSGISAYLDESRHQEPEHPHYLTVPLLDRDNLLESSRSMALSLLSFRRAPEVLYEQLDIGFHNDMGRGKGVLLDWMISLSHILFHPGQALWEPLSDAHPLLLKPVRNAAALEDNLMLYELSGILFALCIFHRAFVLEQWLPPFMIHRLMFDAYYGSRAGLGRLKLGQLLDWVRVYKSDSYAVCRIVLSSSEVEGLDIEIDADGSADAPQALTTKNKGSLLRKHMFKTVFADIDEHAYQGVLRGFRHVFALLSTGVNEIGTIPSLSRGSMHTLLHFGTHHHTLYRALFCAGSSAANATTMDMSVWQSMCESVKPFDETAAADFWRIVGDLSIHNQRTLLRFWSSLTHLPPYKRVYARDTDKPLRLTVFAYTPDCKDAKLPTAATCFGHLRLDTYKDADDMKRCLTIAIRECNTFGLL